MMTENHIQFYTEGALAFCVLNRAKQLNALTFEINQSLEEALLTWRSDSAIKVVIIYSSTERAFCAGGDIKLAYQLGQQTPEKALEFFKLEYEMNLLLATYPKPIIAFCQGITMGGGCGIGFHVSHAIAGNDIKLAMPETKIGLFPDIGASFVLPRLPNQLGEYLGLTGYVLNQDEVLYTGLMQYAMDQQTWLSFLQKIKQLEWSEDAFNDLDHLMQIYKKAPNPNCELARMEPLISKFFAVKSLHDLIYRPPVNMSEEEKSWYEQLLQQLNQRSPQSLLITWEAFKRGLQKTLAEVLQQDLQLAKHCLQNKDFYIGVKACLIDRNEPVWSKESIESYTQDMIDEWFHD